MKILNFRHGFILASMIVICLAFCGCLLGYIPFMTSEFTVEWNEFEKHVENTTSFIRALTKIIASLYVFYENLNQTPRNVIGLKEVIETPSFHGAEEGFSGAGETSSNFIEVEDNLTLGEVREAFGFPKES